MAFVSEKHEGIFGIHIVGLDGFHDLKISHHTVRKLGTPHEFPISSIPGPDVLAYRANHHGFILAGS